MSLPVPLLGYKDKGLGEQAMTATSVLIQESAPGQPPSTQYTLSVPSNRMTVRELIKAYVDEQVRRHNETPIDAVSRHQSPEERILNPSRPSQHQRQRDCQAEFERALQAFSANGFFLLVDGVQVTELEQELTIKPDTTVSFLRLTPLVGG